MQESLLQHLVCPDCRSSLRLEAPTWNDGEIVTGRLVCQADHSFSIRHGIPRFVDGASSSPVTSRVYDHLWQHKRDHLGWESLIDAESAVAFLADRLGLATRPRGILLDVGCGDGRYAVAAAALGLEVIALDMSAGVEIGRAQAPGVHWLQADALSIPLRDEIATHVLACGVIHHTVAPRVAFNECVRLCKPGAVFFSWWYDGAPAGRGWLIRAMQPAPFGMKRIAARLLTAANRLRRRVGRANPVTLAQSTEETYWWTMDMLGPEFRSLHPIAEVRGWLEAAGFGAIVEHPRQTYGYGITATREVVSASAAN